MMNAVDLERVKVHKNTSRRQTQQFELTHTLTHAETDTHQYIHILKYRTTNTYTKILQETGQ